MRYRTTFHDNFLECTMENWLFWQNRRCYHLTNFAIIWGTDRKWLG